MKEEIKLENLQKKDKKEKEKKMYLAMISDYECRKKELIKAKEKEQIEDLIRLKEYKNMLKKQENDKIIHKRKTEFMNQLNFTPKSLSVIHNEKRKNYEEDFSIYQEICAREKMLKKQDEENRIKKILEQENLKKSYDSQIKIKYKNKKNQEKHDKEIVNALIKDSEKFKKFENDQKTLAKKLRLLQDEYLKTQIKQRNNPEL